MYRGCIHSTVDGYLGRFQVRVIMKSAAVNFLSKLICTYFYWADNQEGFDPKCIGLKSFYSSHDSPPPASIIHLISLHNTQ